MLPTFPERYYAQQADDLLRILGEDTKGPARHRIHDLLLEIFEHIPALLPRLEDLIRAERERGSLNYAGLRRVLAVLRDSPKVPAIEASFRSADNEPDGWVNDVERVLTDLEGDVSGGDAGHLALIMSLVLAKRFRDLQAIAVPAPPQLDALRGEVRRAVDKWPDDNVTLQLREAQADFGSVGSPDGGFPRTAASQPLFDAKNVDEARAALVEYVLVTRPSLVRDWLMMRRDSWPNRSIDLAEIVAYESEPSQPAHWPERRAFGSLLRAFGTAAVIYSDQEIRMLELTLRTRRERPLRSLRSISDQVLRHKQDKGAAFLKLVCVEIKNLTLALSALTESTHIEAVLRSYKLRNETMRSTRGFDLDDSMHELDFQRHACAYLLDHGVASSGSKFARSEADLVAEHYSGDEQFVIEAKIVRAGAANGKARAVVEQGFLQLKKYMNDMPTRRRGILLVYSFAPIVWTYPHEWVRRQFRVTVVDLASQPPSKRKSCIAIEEGKVYSGPELTAYDSGPARRPLSGVGGRSVRKVRSPRKPVARRA